MTDPDNLAALRARLARLEERVDMEAGLRAAVDRDLGDVRAALAGQRRVLQAIGSTQGQHTGTLAELGGQLDAVTAAVERIRTDHGAKLEQIIGMLTGLADDDRGQDPA